MSHRGQPASSSVVSLPPWHGLVPAQVCRELPALLGHSAQWCDKTAHEKVLPLYGRFLLAFHVQVEQ